MIVCCVCFHAGESVSVQLNLKLIAVSGFINAYCLTAFFSTELA